MHNCTFVKIMQILISHWTQLSCCTHIAQFWLIIIWRLKCPDWKFYIWGSYRRCKQTLWSKDRTKSCSGKFSFIKTICKRWYFCTKIFYKYFEKAFKQMFSTIGLQVPVLKKHALLDQSQKNFKSWQKPDYQCRALIVQDIARNLIREGVRKIP